ncbi:MAG: SH3 domain-containing protein [Clostridiales bacterium]|nr:SH3 domain-containing protein [Clostridiales bacterium]
MRRSVLFSAAVSLFIILVTLLLAETLIVRVQSTSLRQNPKFYAPVVLALKAGEKVEKVSGQEGWVQVRTSGGVVGWVHSSAVEVQKFSLLAIDKSMKTQASASEVALAGKGFNKQVEESYRAKHGDINFVWVDRMLQIKIPASQVLEFMKQGKLGEFGGAR